MSRSSEIRGAWHPQTRQDRDAVLCELQEVLTSPHFCNSKRYPALLKYIVENTLAGKSDLLKERTLGVEVFDRPATYDTNNDTVVRYTAGEVRKRLLLYYLEQGQDSAIRISLPSGSYVPEFLREPAKQNDNGDDTALSSTRFSNPDKSTETRGEELDAEPDAALTLADRNSTSPPATEINPSPLLGKDKPPARRLLWLAVAALVTLAVLTGLNLKWRDPKVPPLTALDDFWGPVLHDQRTVLICSGGVVFQENNYSGVVTADKNNQYPFVSMQSAAAIAQVSGLLERSGATAQLLSSPSTPLNDLREHSVILLGGYNNRWSMRLLQSQRLQFTPEPVESIADQMQPAVHWSRDRSLPYSSADDYALIARYRDPTTGGWVVVLAGLGRNGTEAAALFATSPRYMQLLRDRLGKGFSNQNIEAVLRVDVIDGKTGAPSILAVNVQ
jgi:hypothetical protein